MTSKLSESSKAILATKETIDKTKKKVLHVVEGLLDDSVTCSELIQACENLSQSDYCDVIEERNILGFCGYPLCSKQIKILSQKYHISCKQNKVFDITERKCFCSNTCFKASKFVQTQLSPEPVWLQKEPVKVELLSDNLNKGIAGEEIEFINNKVSEHDINPVVTHGPSYNSSQVLHEAVQECTSQLEKLIVSEKNGSLLDQSKKELIPTATSSSDVKSTKCDNDDNHNNFVSHKENSDDSELLVSDDDDGDLDEESAFPSFEDENQPVHKCMPAAVKCTFRPSILIDPLPQKVVKPAMPVKSTVSLEFVKNVLDQWLTVDSLKYILGTEFDSLPHCDREINISNIQQREMSLQMNYMKLCKMLDRQEKEEIEMDEKILKASHLTRNGYANTDDSCSEQKPSKEKIPIRKTPTKKKEKLLNEKMKKSVSFAPSTKKGADEKQDETSNDAAEAVAEPVIPLVDSLSQSILRQQIVSDRLKVVYKKILPSIGIYYKGISAGLRDFVVTLNLASDNITYRPNEWKLIALVIFRMLKRKFEVHCSDSEFEELLGKSELGGGVSLSEIDTTLEMLYGRVESS